MALQQAFIATNRFGLGPRPGDLKRIAADPRGWLVQQLQHRQMPAELAALPPPREQTMRFFALRQRIEAEKKGLAQSAAVTAMRRGTMAEPAASEAPARSPIANLDQPIRDIYLTEAGARTLAAVNSDAPLIERLVAFWSNHFTVSLQRPQIAGLCGAFEREAIRPNVLGHFSAMLGAAVSHPAMLVYLDNERSIGPGSIAGRRGGDKGINENLGRELLELHTLGVNGGYTQHDVEAMARMLTGWTITPPRLPGGGTFRFEPRFHEPGPKTLLGATYRDAGMAEVQSALLVLARHPSTARHLAEKLARHFIADDPPAAVVERLAALYRESDGDLGVLTRALIDAPEAWRDPLAKVKAPQDFFVSAARATGYAPQDPKMIVGSLRILGQMPFAAPSPAGWPDRAQDWLSPEALMHRVEWSQAAARKLGTAVSVEALVPETIAPVAAPATLQTIASGADQVERLSLLFASREFQRR
jgi:uncharacterized protein (DUF1800 family)